MTPEIAGLLAVWNLLTSIILGLVMFMLNSAKDANKELNAEVQRHSILLNKTREEIARDYITKSEVRSDMERIINRFDKLEEKLDRVIEGHK
jgi:uncharacterized membrane-anchored protein YhcB (DUF1043 family)